MKTRSKVVRLTLERSDLRSCGGNVGLQSGSRVTRLVQLIVGDGALILHRLDRPHVGPLARRFGTAPCQGGAQDEE